ncbi:hypothetical protein Ahy_B05g079302 isoform E [Arachis hypogaea]|uniref:Uncharacterized protein n=1 Tax=Arachis hypogaea TaxID=3818 RepID=A0A444Z9G6_ARAHY|nr:hypothetical protein Ahy_B05g079302 isoform E [Arachis hypogaea]
MTMRRKSAAMFRSFSTRRGPSKYEKLEKDGAANGISNEELKRSTSLPSSRGFNSSMTGSTTIGDINLQRNPTKKASSNQKSTHPHPLFGFFDLRRKKKTTARPEFIRYLEYMKEGGVWDSNSNKPVIYYK